MSIRTAPVGWLQRWEGIRRKLPSVNPVFRGHPLHALLTDWPATLIPLGFVFTLWGRLTHQRSLESAGYFNTAAGVLAAIPTVLTGLADYLQMEVQDPAQKTGFFHGLCNLTAFSLSVGSLVGRSPRKPATARSLCLSGIATSVLLAGAYLGGDLVFHRGWRVKPIEREEIQTHRVPETVHDEDFLLRRGRGVTVSSVRRSLPSA